MKTLCIFLSILIQCSSVLCQQMYLHHDSVFNMNILLPEDVNIYSKNKAFDFYTNGYTLFYSCNPQKNDTELSIICYMLHYKDQYTIKKIDEQIRRYLYSTVTSKDKRRKAYLSERYSPSHIYKSDTLYDTFDNSGPPLIKYRCYILHNDDLFELVFIYSSAYRKDCIAIFEKIANSISFY